MSSFTTNSVTCEKHVSFGQVSHMFMDLEHVNEKISCLEIKFHENLDTGEKMKISCHILFTCLGFSHIFHRFFTCFSHV